MSAILRAIPSALDELDIAITRQTHLADRSLARSGDRPLPFAADAAEIHHDLSIAVARWARNYGSARYASGIARSGAPRACAGYLVRMLPAIVRHPDAGPMWRDLDRLVDRARRMIDRPPDVVFVGICSVDGCEQDVYAQVDAAVVVCPRCHARHDVAERRAVMLAAAEDQLATAVEIARAVAAYGAEGEHVNTATMRKWTQRGRLIARGVGARGELRYRVGDVLDLIRRPRRASR